MKIKGDVTNKIYKIGKTVPIEMHIWKSKIEKIGISDTVKDGLIILLIDIGILISIKP